MITKNEIFEIINATAEEFEGTESIFTIKQYMQHVMYKINRLESKKIDQMAKDTGNA